MGQFEKNVKAVLELDYGTSVEAADTIRLYHAVSKAAMAEVGYDFATKAKEADGKQACYLSAEFLVGRLVYNNLLNLGLLRKYSEMMEEHKRDIWEFEEIEDAALGNGGLGRLAACFLDSGATIGITLNGYGIRYQYGLFCQYFEDGFQKEAPDDWTKAGDPWSVRAEEEKVCVHFKDQDVYAVPYDMPIIGYGAKKTNLLRLWQAEPLTKFHFDAFNEQRYDAEAKERTAAAAISAILYPNDSKKEGKRLRLKQQYFFSSASLQDMLRTFKKVHGTDVAQFPSFYAVQLNDTHPTVAIPEMLRILMEEEGVSFACAFNIAKETFAYTNHTIMAEALETWEIPLFKSVLPHVYKYVAMLQKALRKELGKMGVPEGARGQYDIISGNRIHMARMAIFASHSTNGVAQIHTDILKNKALKEWYALYPERFNNKTNGITQRRWLALANMELSGFISDRIGSGWITDLSKLKKLEGFADDVETIRQFAEIKKIKKQQLSDYVFAREGVRLNAEFLFDVQIKRLHEYKRQLLNAFSILDIYFGLKEGRIEGFAPTAFIFGAKAAPGYERAKGIIKFINEISKLVAADDEVNGKLQVVFVQNYNVSYAEKLVAAADVSEQISLAGTEASGTGNMKLMLNGAVTLGTYDGANVEIVAEAGMENNYIFGKRVEEIEELKGSYNPREIYESNQRLKKAVDTLVDGTLSDGGTGMFEELYRSLLDGAAWHQPDHYFLFADFDSYCEAKLRANKDYQDTEAFRKKCFLNTANAGKFSSDRTIRDYVKDIWML